jgi:hypothetical protein
MRRVLFAFATLSLVTVAPTATDAQRRDATSQRAESPAVKLSRNGICHPRGGTYYSRTIHYTPYRSMDECIRAGGRRPKR